MVVLVGLTGDDDIRPYRRPRGYDHPLERSGLYPDE
jgi:hypothetical protein